MIVIYVIAGIIAKDVLCVANTLPAFEAFKAILENEVTAVGVLNGQRLVANLSASDLRVCVYSCILIVVTSISCTSNNRTTQYEIACNQMRHF